MKDWIESLTGQQVRALASQAGISSWMTFPVSKLRNLLLDNKNAQQIFEKNYTGI